MKNTRNYASMLGQAGVYRVISELILRGQTPLVPVVDDGVDLMLASGIRLQVKTTFTASRHWRYANRTVYSFTLGPSKMLKGGNVASKEGRKFSAQCDFVILLAINESRFWIVPAAALDKRYTVTICEKELWRNIDVQKAKELQAQGYSSDAIAAVVGGSRRTVSRRLLDGKTEPDRKWSNVGSYENRWDLIESYGKTISEANAAAVSPVTV